MRFHTPAATAKGFQADVKPVPTVLTAVRRCVTKANVWTEEAVASAHNVCRVSTELNRIIIAGWRNLRLRVRELVDYGNLLIRVCFASHPICNRCQML